MTPAGTFLLAGVFLFLLIGGIAEWIIYGLV
jgi:hypothetical protein